MSRGFLRHTLGDKVARAAAKPSSGTPLDMVEEALQASSGRRRATEQGVLLRPMYKVTAIRARCLDALLLPIALGGAPLRGWTRVALDYRKLAPRIKAVA